MRKTDYVREVRGTAKAQTLGQWFPTFSWSLTTWSTIWGPVQCTTLFQENLFNQTPLDQAFRKLDSTQKRHVQNGGQKHNCYC